VQVELLANSGGQLRKAARLFFRGRHLALSRAEQGLVLDQIQHNLASISKLRMSVQVRLSRNSLALPRLAALVIENGIGVWIGRFG
jgi:hypothetical protein